MDSIIATFCWTEIFLNKQFCFLYTFQQDNAPAHRDHKMVEFLARETPDFIIFELLGAAVVNNLLHRTKVHHQSKIATDSTG